MVNAVALWRKPLTTNAEIAGPRPKKLYVGIVPMRLGY
jgi:hypothetical protein